MANRLQSKNDEKRKMDGETPFIALGGRARDISGIQFGRFSVLGPIERTSPPSGGTKIKWLCECACGKRFVADGNNIKSGNTKSCGCASSEATATRNRAGAKYSMPDSPEVYVWRSMHFRCSNPSAQNYERYGGRGIKVCQRWDDFESFLADMGPRPSPQHSLDRKDNSKGYEPGNVHWTTADHQARNRRSSFVVTAFGRTASLADFISPKSDKLKYKHAYRDIMKGMNAEAAITNALKEE